MIFSSKFFSIVALSTAALGVITTSSLSASTPEQEELLTQVSDTDKRQSPSLYEDSIKALSITHQDVEDYRTDPSKIRYVGITKLLREDKADEAAKMATEALALRDPVPAGEMGNYFFLRDAKKAVFWLTKAHEKENTSATGMLAYIRRKEGNLEEAKRLAITAFEGHEYGSLNIFAKVFKETHPTFSKNCHQTYWKIMVETENILKAFSHPSPLVSQIYTAKMFDLEKLYVATHTQDFLREDCPEELLHLKK